MKTKRKIKRFEKILKTDEDWDYFYLLRLEYRKLSLMLKYFENSEIVDTTFIVRDIRLCLKLLEITMESDPITNYYYSTQTLNHYVNIKNTKRFAPYNFESINEDLAEGLKVDLRIRKAFSLYNKIRAYRMLTWWD